VVNYLINQFTIDRVIKCEDENINRVTLQSCSLGTTTSTTTSFTLFKQINASTFLSRRLTSGL